MIGIYLCDDEEAVLHQLKTALEWKIFIENYDMEVACAASSAGELLAAARSLQELAAELHTHLAKVCGQYNGCGENTENGGESGPTTDSEG